jgi:large subunit ribosomal protein L22e
MHSAAFEKFLNDRVKVDGRTGNLGDVVNISREGEGKIQVVAHGPFSGRYLKYLTKKFLKKHQLRDWLRVVATSKGTYTLKFYNVQMDGEDAEEDDE